MADVFQRTAFGFFTHTKITATISSITSANIIKILPKPPLLPTIAATTMGAVEETGRGVFEDKATKNLFACENVVRRLRDLKTVGVISENDVTGITEIA
ncbi:hypothetical protein L7A47_33285, partial [Achromobacter xylosoxidans]|nr:hypothetical protein [Achromobacter xylosoxidans]